MACPERRSIASNLAASGDGKKRAAPEQPVGTQQKGEEAG